MGWLEGLLRTRGRQVTILRNPPVTSYVSMSRLSRSTDPAVREAVWSGWILPDSNLASGELMQVGPDTFLVQSVTADPTAGALQWFAVRTNATVDVLRLVEQYDDYGNLIDRQWEPIATQVAVWGEIVTARLRQADPGLLDSARYVFQMPKSVGIQVLDRVVYNGGNYQVQSIDDIAMSGVVRVQLGADTRP